MARTTGAHELYQKLLDSYTLKDIAVGPFKDQLKRTFEMINSHSDSTTKDYERGIEECNANLKKLNKRWAIGEIDKEPYNEVKNDLLLQKEIS